VDFFLILHGLFNYLPFFLFLLYFASFTLTDFCWALLKTIIILPLPFSYSSLLASIRQILFTCFTLFSVPYCLFLILLTLSLKIWRFTVLWNITGFITNDMVLQIQKIVLFRIDLCSLCQEWHSPPTTQYHMTYWLYHVVPNISIWTNHTSVCPVLPAQTSPTLIWNIIYVNIYPT
jgi:hypothetical protein